MQGSAENRLNETLAQGRRDLKASVDEALDMGGCEAVRNVVVYRRTGGEVALKCVARSLVARARGQASRHLRAGMGERRAPAIRALHAWLDGHTQGRSTQHGWV